MVRRRGPRHKYYPVDVVSIVLQDGRYCRICEVLLESDRPMHAYELSSYVGLHGAYIYKLLKRLEKWGVVRGYRDPANGKLAFTIADTDTGRAVAEELRKRKAKQLEQTIVRQVAVEL